MSVKHDQVASMLYAELDGAQLQAVLADIRARPALLTQTVRDAAAEQNVRVLAELARHGVFSFQAEDRRYRVHEALFAYDEIPVVAALANVIEKLEDVKVQVGGRNTWEPNEMGLGREMPVSEEFRRFFSEQTLAFMDSFKRWRMDRLHEADRGAAGQEVLLLVNEQRQHYYATLQALMAAACAMNGADLAVAIVQDDVDVLGKPMLRPALLGPRAPDTLEVDGRRQEYVLYPWVLAVDTSAMDTIQRLESMRCRDRLWPGIAPCTAAGTLIDVDDRDKETPFGPSLLMNRKVIGTQVETMAHIVATLFEQHAHPLEAAHLDQDQSARQLDELVQYMGECMADNQYDGWTPHFIDMGLHRHDVRSCMAMAIFKNDDDFLERIRDDIDWRTDAKHVHPVWQEAAQWRLGHTHEEQEGGLMRWLQWAVEDNQVEHLLGWRLQQDSSVDKGLGIADALVRRGFKNALGRLIDLGLDPLAVNGKDKNLIEVMAERMDAVEQAEVPVDPDYRRRLEETRTLLRAWLAHRKAIAAVDEITRPSPLTP